MTTISPIRWSKYATTEETQANMRESLGRMPHNVIPPTRGYISQALDVVSGMHGKYADDDVAKARRILKVQHRASSVTINCIFASK